MKIDLNDLHFYYTNNNLEDLNHVGIGYDCSLALPAKLSVLQTHPNQVLGNSTTISALNEDESAGAFGSTNTAVLGHTYGIPIDHIDYRVNRGGDFFATNSYYNNGVLAYALNGLYDGGENEAGVFRAYGGKRAAGIVSNASSAVIINYGVYSIASDGDDAYGIFAEANGAANNYSAYFSGAGVSGTDWFWLSIPMLVSEP